MRKQRDISYSMRAILVDWLVEVAEEYKLHQQTLFMAVAYIDRFLSEMSVQRGKLQLVGVTCMLLAAKYEEIYPPAIEEFVYITDNTYTRDQVTFYTRVIKGLTLADS
jgi:cyclin A